jgi:hypothetical protein
MDQNQQNLHSNNHQIKQNYSNLQKKTEKQVKLEIDNQVTKSTTNNNFAQNNNNTTSNPLEKTKSHLSLKSFKSIKSQKSTKESKLAIQAKNHQHFVVRRLDMNKVSQKLLKEVELSKKDYKFEETEKQQKSEAVSDSETSNNINNTYKKTTKKNKKFERSPLIRDTRYEDLCKKYLSENYTIATLNIVNRIILRSNEAIHINNTFPLHSAILKLCRSLLLSDIELCVFSIYLERLGWQCNYFDPNQYLHIIAILTKYRVSDDAQIIVKSVFKEVPNLEISYNEFIQIKIEKEKYDVLFVGLPELNRRYLLLNAPFNTTCKNNFMDYNYCVDQILSMSLPYSENKKTNNVKNLVSTISVPNFKNEVESNIFNTKQQGKFDNHPSGNYQYQEIINQKQQQQILINSQNQLNQPHLNQFNSKRINSLGNTNNINYGFNPNFNNAFSVGINPFYNNNVSPNLINKSNIQGGQSSFNSIKYVTNSPNDVINNVKAVEGAIKNNPFTSKSNLKLNF